MGPSHTFVVGFMILLLASTLTGQKHAGVPEDNEFAEFEVADDANPPLQEGYEDSISQIDAGGESTSTPPNGKESEAELPTNEDEEFDAYEVENEGTARRDGEEGDAGPNKPVDIKPLTFSDIPTHFRSNWSSYQVEAVAIVIILLYVANYAYGRTANQIVAQEWFAANRGVLEQQFALVGDDGVTQEPQGGHMFKETDSSFSVWCTGRAGCKGMLSQIRLKRRQDLVGLTASFLWPKPDRVVHRVEFDRGELDSFVFVMGQRKNVLKLVKEMLDLSTYVTERKGEDKFGLPPNFCVFAELGETLPPILDSSMLQFDENHRLRLEYLHISDQFSGAKQQEELTKLPETKSILVISYLLPGQEAERDETMLLNFIFYLIEKLRRYRLSREGRQKAEKKRQNVEESFLRSTHQQRQEQAMARREERTRERKQRVLEEEDPEKQKRLEKLEQKREAKMKGPKIKQLKIK